MFIGFMLLGLSSWIRSSVFLLSALLLHIFSQANCCLGVCCEFLDLSLGLGLKLLPGYCNIKPPQRRRYHLTMGLYLPITTDRTEGALVFSALIIVALA